MQYKRYKIGICWGVWDFMHEGHLNLLEAASNQCYELIVGVSTDEYVESVKNKKPFFTFKHRIRLVNSLDFVSAAVPQGLQGNGKKEMVDIFKPDVIFVGDDWDGKDWNGAKLGVPVVYLPYTKGISSTEIMKKVCPTNE